jgi:hypothetical protein
VDKKHWRHLWGRSQLRESVLNLALFFPLIYQNFHSFYLSMGISTKIGAQRELPFTLFRAQSEARPLVVMY